MNYISNRSRGICADGPHDITYEDIRNLWRENKKDAEKCRRVTESTDRGETYYPDGRVGEGKISDWRLAFFKEILYRDNKAAGFTMEYPHGVVICQGERNSYYRGESQQYLKSQPTLFRKMEQYTTQEAQELYRFVADMRIGEFFNFLRRIDVVKFWEQHYGTVLYEALAQHYGLETRWLDITNDFAVALFFATCYWESNRWKPLISAQLEQNDDTRYGIIFHAPATNVQIYNALNYKRFMKSGFPVENMVLPIGFQPFMRCHCQYSYGIPMITPVSLQEMTLFERLRFRHSEKLSRAVFEAMKEGKLIYPQEGLNEFEDVIRQIRTARCFSEKAFAYALERNPLWKDELRVRKALIEGTYLEFPIQITENQPSFSISRQRIWRLNRQYQKFDIMQTYGIQPKSRIICKPES